MQLRFPKARRESRCETEEQEERRLVWWSQLPGVLGKCCFSLVGGKAVLEKLYKVVVWFCTVFPWLVSVCSGNCRSCSSRLEIVRENSWGLPP